MFRIISSPLSSRPTQGRRIGRPALVALCATLAVSGCGGFGSDSGLNPLRWLGGGGRATGPTSLAPKGGYRDVDRRQPVAGVVAARWEPMTEGRLLVVNGLAPTSGWWDIGLVTETPQPAGRLRADADGVLRLRLVGSPPAADRPESRMPAVPSRDLLTAALPLDHGALDSLSRVVITGAGNSVTLSR